MNTYYEKMPIVSVMCPCYNHEPYLRQALDSILSQKTSFPIEILVGEDCSPDNSRNILREYESQYPNIFRMFYREKNMGATQNGHDLRMRAKGKYVITLETDDYWTDPQKLQKQVDFLESNPEYIACAHNCYVVDEFNQPIASNSLKCFKSNTRYTLQDFQKKTVPFQTATLLCRNIFKDGGDYSIICTAHPMVGDFTITSLLLTRGDILIMPEYMSAYRRVIHQKSASFSAYETHNRAQSFITNMQMLIRLDEYFDGQIDYSYKKQNVLNPYLADWIRRRPGFTIEGLRYLWLHSSFKVRVRSIIFLLSYPVRKMQAHFNQTQ